MKIKKIETKTLSIINLSLFLITIFVNFLGARGFINGASQSDVSQMFPTLITPAGFTFGIWGVIYTLLFLSFLLSIFKDKTYKKITKKISVLFWISCFFNMAWIFVFSYKLIWLSAILIILLFVSVFKIILEITKKSKVSIFDLSFGLYAGWLAIASLVNFSAFLVSFDFGFFSYEKLFYTLALVIFLIFAIFIQKLHKNPFFNLSIAWAFFGIIMRINFTNYTDYLFLTLLFGIFILIFGSVRILLKKKDVIV